MPKWPRNVHKFAAVFMSVLFVGLALIGARMFFLAPHDVPSKAPLVFSTVFVLFAVFAIASQIRFQRSLITEFRYDGSTIQFQTLGIQEAQMRPVSDIAAIRDWRGKGGPLGYRLVLQDGRKLYLEFSVSNSVAFVNQLRADLRL